MSLLSDDKDNEDAHVLLMRLYALSGQRQQALRQYQALREALQADLEIEPSETTTQLYEAIQANRLAPAAVSTQPLNPGVEPRHNLPVQLTSFIGREKEIVEVCHQVRQYRLVTLNGRRNGQNSPGPARGRELWVNSRMEFVMSSWRPSSSQN